jgi:hydroxymethylpyrimidine pyrophosphatase-like HAD family hydrolase
MAVGVLRWPVLASDLDGTLASAGIVPPETVAALGRYREAGGTVVLVTGRRRTDLVRLFPDTLAQTELVVAENGALLFGPDDTTPRALGPERPGVVLEAMADAGLTDLEVGQVLVASDREDEHTFRRVAKELSGVWECTVVPNKDRVMLLPAGLDKGTGLAAALDRLGRTADEVVAIGDAENDIPLLRSAGLGVAVATSEPDLLSVADVVTAAGAGEALVELVDLLLSGEGGLAQP